MSRKLAFVSIESISGHFTYIEKRRRSFSEEKATFWSVRMAEDQHYKVVMLGDSGVGKIALVNRISEDVFTDSPVPTVGSQFIALPLNIKKRKMTLELWDTASQEVYRSLVGSYTREAKGAFLVFDVTSEATFESLPTWLKFLTEQAPGAKVIIFANKCDLEDQRVVSSERLRQFGASQKVDVIEGSAKLGQNTTDAFEKMGEMMLSTEANVAPAVTIKEEPKKKKKRCCR
jgi:small GTP-binding protein